MKKVLLGTVNLVVNIVYYFVIFVIVPAIVISLLNGSIVLPAAGPSMNPTFPSITTQYLYWDFDEEDINRFDIVQADDPEIKYHFVLKRIIGMPGEHIQITNDVLTVNGTEVEQPFEFIPTGYDYEVDVILGEDEYFLMGDNRANSQDSRAFGPVAEEDIRFLYNEGLSESWFGKITIPLLETFASIPVVIANGISELITGEQFVPTR